MNTYLLDANVFIEAKNRYYGLDFCPAFWSWLDMANEDGRVFSIEKIGDELLAGADELAVWTRERGEGFFLRPDATVLPSLQAVSAWASGGGFHPAAVSTFLQVGDFYLVAHAHAQGFVVVTHETPGNSTKKIKIPNPCIELGVKCITPFEMLRLEQARFVLGAARGR